jgi:hypothetical protein
VGLEDPAVWALMTTATGAVATLGGLYFKLIREKIRADRDRSLLEIALRDSRPDERREILEGLAELRPLNAQAPREQDDGPRPVLPVKLPRKRRA